jgi:hypothetical protein
MDQPWLDGQPHTAESSVADITCPLPTLKEWLRSLLISLQTVLLQVDQGQLLRMRQRTATNGFPCCWRAAGPMVRAAMALIWARCDHPALQGG